MIAVGNDLNLRLQLQFVLPGIVVGAFGGTGRLLRLEPDHVIGMCRPRLLIERQGARHQV